MTYEMNISPADEVELSNQYWSRLQEWNGYTRQTPGEAGHTLAVLARDYPTLTPELGAAIAYSGLDPSDPMIHEIIAIDSAPKESGIWGLAQKAGRFVTGELDNLWMQGIPRAVNTAINVAQGDDLWTAYRQSGQDIHAASIEDARVNDTPLSFNRTYGSSGFMAGDNPDPALQPGASEVFKGYASQGYDPATAMEYTRAYQSQNDRGSMFDKSKLLSESTMLHNTLGDGRTVAYHATPGRAAWYPVLKGQDPNSALFKQVTGWTDLTFQVALDPSNPAVDRLTETVRARNTAVRARDLSIKETADATAREFGGVPLDDTDGAQYFDSMAFHGTTVDVLDGGVINQGGITNNLDEAVGFAKEAETGRVYVVEPDDLPPTLKQVYRTTENLDEASGYMTIEQIIPETTAAGAFPDIDPSDLLEEARRVAGANKYINDDVLFDHFNAYDATGEAEGMAHQLYGLYDPQYADDIAAHTPGDLVMDGDIFENAEQIREAVEQWDESDDLVNAIDDFVEAQEILATSPLTADDLNPVQKALVDRMGNHLGGREFVWGNVDEAITPIASFSVDELEEMASTGYIFKTREGWADYQKWAETAEEMGATKTRGKWGVNPATWEHFSQQGRGRRLFEWAAESDYATIKASKELTGMSDDGLWRLHYTNDPTVAEAIIKQWYGGPSSRYKVPGRSRTANALSSVQHRLGAPGQINLSVASRLPDRMTRFGRRMTAEMGHSTIDPYDADVTFDYVQSMGRLLGKTNEDISKAMSWLDMNATKINPTTRKPIKSLRDRGRFLQDELYDWLHADLAAEHGDEYAEYVINEWRKAEAKNQQFAENAAARPLELRNAPGRRLRSQTDPNGEGLVLMADEPLHDAHLAQRHHYMPSVREIRRATARIRNKTEAARTAHYTDLNRAVGLGTSKSQKFIDGYLAGWRNLALLRIGWMMRVLPDEIARLYMSGYNDIATNPVSYILYSAGKKGDYLDETTSLHQMTEAMGLGADNGLFRGIDNQPYIETSQRGANWNRAKATTNGVTLTQQGAQGISRRFLQLYQSQMANVIYDHATIEDALRYLVDNVDDNNILREIWASAEPGTGLHRSASFDAGAQARLRTQLEAIDAQRHQWTGGAWIGKNRNGRWVDMYGDEIDLYDDLSLKALRDEAKLRGVAVRGTKEEIRARLLQLDGMPGDLWKRNESYIITKQGQPELLEVIRHGRMQGTPNPNRAKVNAARDWQHSAYPKRKTGDDVWVLLPKDGHVSTLVRTEGSVQVFTDFDVAASKLEGIENRLVPIDSESLPPSVFMRKRNKNGTITLDADDIKRAEFGEHELVSDRLYELQREALEEGTIPLMNPAMGKAELQEFEEFLTNAYTPDYPPVRHVSVPDKPYMDFEDQKTFIDQMFTIIGQNPTLYGVRRPFSTLRTWEVMAGHYVGASPAVRKAIMANAEKAGMTERFSDFVEQQLKARNLTRPTQSHGATVDEIVSLSWTEAIDDTKDIFYDLTKGGAWQDASRLVFPFADAWWEVLTRWARLANPAVTGGQPIRAASRATSAFYGAESSGWFTTNEQGKRVFEIPGTAEIFNLINQTSGISLSGQVSLDQLTFVDFGDPGSAMKPGFTPQAQWIAAEVRNLTFDNGWFPEQFRDQYDKFFFGDFTPPGGTVGDLAGTLGMFLPTHLRRAVSRIWRGEFDEDYASMQVRIANGIAARVGDQAATNQDVAKQIVDESRQAASLLGTLDIFGSFLTPAQPRKVAEILLMDQEGTEYMKSLSALATDYSFMKQLYGPDLAVDMFIQAYGFDPLKLAPTYWTDERAPVTNDSWEYMLSNPAINEHTRYTTMAWVPQDDDSEFNIDAWRAADYERMTGRDAAEYWSYAAGAHRMGALRDARDKVLEDLEKRYGGTDNDGYRYMKNEVISQWYNVEKNNIATQYYGYVPGEGLAGVENRPSYQRVWNEITHIGDPSSVANKELREVDPELVDFIEYATSIWNTTNQAALAAGYGAEWWRESESEKNGAPAIRQLYSKSVSDYVANFSPEARAKAEYIGQFFLAPMLQDFDWDNPVVIAPSTPSTEQLGYADTLGARNG